jgi:hypothetical protein
MADDGSVASAVKECEATCTAEKSKSHKDDERGHQKRAELEKKVMQQEQTNVAQDNAPKKYVILSVNSL